MRTKFNQIFAFKHFPLSLLRMIFGAREKETSLKNIFFLINKVASLFNTFYYNSHLFSMRLAFFVGFPGGASNKEATSRCGRHEAQVWSLGQEDPLEEGMATYFSILVWRIPGTEEPGGLQCIAQSWTQQT